MTRLHLNDDIREVAFAIGQEVFLKCRDEKVRGLVCGYYVWPGEIAFNVSWGNGQDSTHYEFELTTAYRPDYAPSEPA